MGLLEQLHEHQSATDFDAVVREERRWIAMRDICRADVRCISQWYDQRLWILRGAMAGASQAPAQREQTAAPSTQRAIPAQPQRVKIIATGTGYIVTADGAIITNNHVIAECPDDVTVQLDRQQSKGEVIARDPRNDLALITSKLQPRVVPALRTGVRLGENIVVFGYPIPEFLASSGNFTVGNVTATEGLKDDTGHVQISAPIQPGNSGGPVLDQDGNVVATVDSTLNAINMAKETGNISENVNFAIKETVVENFLDANGVRYSTAALSAPMQAPDLADRARTFTVFIFSTCVVDKQSN